ncbi:amino acid ABC transporter substrate-binding protein [Herbaspirillum lusitanum]|jgi:glutamate/aspartate transport system substrate-binding protein|uniref:Amino acid ABC transporter substrate-binding protein n=1 Tax=Herbaspirillum lusitanum TaxID=213312 RepID=A0ABW9AEX3_9BURK
MSAYPRTGGRSAVWRLALIWAALAHLCLAAGYARAEDTLSKIRRTQTVVIAYANHQMPFVDDNPDGQVYGYSIDICNKIVEALRLELKLPQIKTRFIRVDSVGRFDSLLKGESDIECGASTNNASRRQQVAFTIPHFFTTTRMLVRKDSTIHDWGDLREKRVALVRGNAVFAYAKSRNEARMLDIKWTEVASEAEAMKLVEAGSVDAYVEDDVLLFSYRTEMKSPEQFAIVGEALSVDPYAMMMRKNDAPFKAVVDREMVRMITQKEIYQFYDRWFMRPLGINRAALNLPMSYLLRDSLRFPTDKVAD